MDLEANSSTTVSVNDTASEVQLSCEMLNFIREDEDLQWFKEGQVISSGMDRHNVTYSDGKPGVAVKGGISFIPGRVTVLTISNPEIEDSGTYSCAVAETDESIEFQLSVVLGPGRCPPIHLLTLYQPMTHICVMSSHKPIRTYMGGLILGVNTLYRLFCFFTLFLMVGKGLTDTYSCGHSMQACWYVSLALRSVPCGFLHWPFS